MHKSYEINRGHPCDFRVSYQFFTEEEGGRRTIPGQGYRSDFWYDHPEHRGYYSMVFMIWPEFEDVNGNVIEQTDRPVSKSGTARMWICDPERRIYHGDKIKLGLTGYFMEGSRRVAKCEVIEIVGLHGNPKSR